MIYTHRNQEGKSKQKSACPNPSSPSKSLANGGQASPHLRRGGKTFMGKMMNGAAVTSLRSNGGAVDTCSKGISSSSSAPKAEKSLIFQITESSSRIFLLTAPTTAVTAVVAIVVGRSVGRFRFRRLCPREPRAVSNY